MNQSIRSSLRAGILGLSVLVAQSAFAHPGHGVLDQGLPHALTSSTHLLVLAVAGGTVAVTASLLRSAQWRMRVRCAGLGAVVLAAGLWMI